MANHRVAIASAVVAVAAIIGATFFALNHGNAPVSTTAPSVTASPKINATPEIPGAERKQPKFRAPTPDFASLSSNPADAIELFGKLTIPHPNTWGGIMSEEWRARYEDRTTCTAASSQCPHIEFIDQSSPDGRKLLGKDPVKWWEGQPCAGGAKQKVEGPVSMKLGGQSAKLYRVRCGTSDLVYNYAWFVPSKKLLVTGSSGTEGAVGVGTIQAALERVSWTS